MAFVALVDMFDVRAGDTLTGPQWPLAAMARFVRRGKVVWVPDGREADFVASMAKGVIPEYCRRARVRRRRWNWAAKHIARAVAERSEPKPSSETEPAPEAPPYYSETTLTTKLTKPVLVELGRYYGLGFKTSMSKAEMVPFILDAQAQRTAEA